MRAGAEGRGRAHGHRLAFPWLAVLVACGVGTFVGLRGTVHDLDRSLASFYDETHFADLVVVGGEIDAFRGTVTHFAEVFVAAAVGIVAGAVLGTVGANHLVDALDSDLIHLVRHIDASTYVLASVAVLVTTAVVLTISTISVATAPRRSSTE